MSFLALSILLATATTLWTATAQSPSTHHVSPQEKWILKQILDARHSKPPASVSRHQFLPIQEMLTSLTIPQYQPQNNPQLDAHITNLSSTNLHQFSPHLRQALAPPTGVTLDPCQTNSDCTAERYCVDLDTAPFVNLCFPGTGNRCHCLPALPSLCTSNSQCDSGELCAFYRDIASFAICISEFIAATDLAFTTVATNPAISPLPSPVAGVTFDFCQRPRDCIGDRRCLFIGDGLDLDDDSLTPSLEACKRRDPCLCLPEEEVNCSSRDDCPVGEVCLVPRSGDANICISRTTFSFIGLPLGREVEESPNPLTSGYGSGLTLDPCERSGFGASFCEPGRTCYRSPPIQLRECGGGLFENCQCYPQVVVRCISDDDCVSGEVCRIEAASNVRMCLSEAALQRQPSLSAESSEVCIGVNALQHFGKEELVYGEHRLSRVYCDENGSCATGGHMVVYNGRAMMMRTYCDGVGCSEEVMLVNSPRRRRGMRVRSNTGGLEFTAFAARYETVGEELVLSAVVHIGL